MIDYETIARNNHRSGMNCAMAVYDALGTNNTGKTSAPSPRGNGHTLPRKRPGPSLFQILSF